MLTRYIDAAMRHIEIEENEEGDLYPDQRFIGTIPPCQGVIGIGSTREECRHDTQESLEGWIILGLQLNEALPVIDGINLTPVKIAA